MAEDEFIQLRISKEEKERVRKESKKRGFGTMSTFIKWLIADYFEKKK